MALQSDPPSVVVALISADVVSVVAFAVVVPEVVSGVDSSGVVVEAVVPAVEAEGRLLRPGLLFPDGLAGADGAGTAVLT